MTQSRNRVSILVPDLVAGGAQRSMIKLAGGLAAIGYHVDLVLARATGPLLAEVPHSVRLVDLGARRTVASLPPLISYLRREKPAAMLSVLHTNLIAIWARSLTGIPQRLVVSERNTLSSEVHAYAPDVRMRLMPLLVRRFYPWADCVVAVSQGVADDLAQYAKLPRQQIRVIYNPIVTPELCRMAGASLDHPWFLPGETPVVLAVGRLEEQKDFETLLRAFARVRRLRPARLLILGEGAERPRLEALSEQLQIQRHVRLPGFVDNPYPYMTRAGVIVLSSRWEGLPGVLIEGLYCGVPLVSTDCPSGPKEILANGRYGRLVPVGDEVKLASAIEAALQGDVPRPPHESWQPYRIDAVVGQYEEALFGELPVAKRRSPLLPESAGLEEMHAN